MSSFDPRGSANSVASTRSSSRHQFKRSLTELTSPVKLGRQPRRERGNDERTATAPPVAIANANAQYQGRISLELPWSEAVTPSVMSPDQSRRPSVMASREEENKVPGVVAVDAKLNTEAKLQEEREKACTRVQGLKESLDHLDTFSTTTSRQLDETYYAVLEKVSSLQSSMAAMKELAVTTRDIHKGFEKDSREIENDITVQLAGLGQFQEQQASIESLRRRVHNGRAKIRSLSDRVDVVRARIECWERADNEWQERTRKRLKTVWVFISIIALTMMIIYLGAHYVPPTLEMLNLDSSSIYGTAETSEAVPDAKNDSVLAHELDEVFGLADGGHVEEQHVEGDEPLRIFDEL